MLYQGSFVPSWLLSSPGLSASAKLCYGRLFRYSTTKGYCYPTQERLAQELGISLEQVRRLLKTLEKRGFIERTPPPKGKRFSKISTVYTFPQHKDFTKTMGTPVVMDDRWDPVVMDDHSIYNNKLLYKSSIKDKSLIPDNIPSEAKASSGIRATHKLHRRSSSQVIKSDKSKLAPKLKQREPKPLPRVPAKVRSVLKYWEGRGLHLSREGTKSHRDSVMKVVALFKGSAFTRSEFDEYQRRKFTIKEIRKSIDRFALSALNPDYLPTNDYKKRLKGYTIGAFIYSPFSHNGTGKSLFIHYLENPAVVARMSVQPLEDEYPKVTSALKRAYSNHYLGGVAAKFTVQEENHFITAAGKLLKFMKKNRGKIQWHQQFTPALLASWMVSAVDRDVEGQKGMTVTPGWFSSELMFNRRLPGYLHSQALLGEEVDLSGGTRVGFLH
jgi:biotin operon repressor